MGKVVQVTGDNQTKKTSTPVSVGVGRETVDMRVADAIAKGEKDEYWKEFGHEIELEKEMAEIGIEKADSGEVPVPEDLAKKIGVKAAVEPETPIHKVVTDFSVRGKVLTDDQLTSGKKQPPSKSFRWLVEWFIYELLKAHILVRFIKGKILRQPVLT